MQTALRRELQIEHTRKVILQAAARTFARRGFDAATMQDIAKEAGYTAASLYAYFKGKQDIFQELLTLLTDDLRRTFEEPMPSGLDFAQKLEILLRRQLVFAQGWREAISVLLAFKYGACRGFARKGAHPSIPDSNFYTHHLMQWLKKTARPEEIGGRKLEDVAYILAGSLEALYSQWLVGQPQGRLEDRVELILDIFLHGIGGAGIRERARQR